MESNGEEKIRQQNWETYYAVSAKREPVFMEAALIYIVMGYGDGSYIRKLLAKLSREIKVLVLEPDADSYAYAKAKYGEILGEEERFFCYDYTAGEEGLRRVLKRFINIRNMYHIALSFLEGGAERYPEAMEQLKCLIREHIQNISAEENRALHFGEKLAFNEIYALAHLKENYLLGQLMDAIKEKEIPVILVAAGPSLSKNMEELRGVRGKALVIALQHSAKTLDQAGIPVDFVSVLDGKSGFHYLDGDSERKHLLLMAATGALDEQEHYQGRCYYYGFQSGAYGLPFLGGYHDVGQAGGGSVATATMLMLLRGGFRRFILIGQDLAYGEDGNTHAGGEKQQGNTNDSETFEVAGIYGGTVKTRWDWLQFLREYELLIRTYTDAEVIDATEGGARIEGSIVMSLRNAIGKWCTKKYPVEEWLNSIEKKAVSAEETEAVRSALEDKFRMTSDFMDYLEEGVALNKRLTEAQSAQPELLTKYDRLYHRILEEEDGAYLRQCYQAKLYEYLNHALTTEGAGREKEKLEKEGELFRALCDGGVKLCAWLREQLEFMEN